MENKQNVLSGKFIEVIETNNLENKDAFEIAKWEQISMMLNIHTYLTY